jgi:hypothetical protein
MQQFLLLFGFLFLATTGYTQDVYVNASATDGGDGTTWATAYNDLTVALNAATPGSNVWVAAGTYTTPDSSSFFINEELSLYGGFAGTETSVDQADPATNITILSGDVLGNDPTDMSYDSTLMDDNNRVLTIQDTTEAGNTYRVVVDGFTITNGVIASDGAFSLARFGGGLLSIATVDVSRVRFTRNRANFGSATGIATGRASGSTFTNIVSENNYPSRTSVHYSNGTDSVGYFSSTFSANEMDTVAHSMISTIFFTGFTVDDCSFTNIIAPGARGGAINTNFGFGSRITNSTFNNVIGDLGGAIHVASASDDSTRVVTVDDAIIDSCAFLNVRSPGPGGAVAFYSSSGSVLHSDFDTITSADLGGAIIGNSFSDEAPGLSFAHRIEGSTFDDVTSRGGAICMFSDNRDISITDSDFNRNFATANGGGAILLVGSFLENEREARIVGCTFDRNAAPFGMAVWLLDQRAVVDDCLFTNHPGNDADGTLYAGGGKKLTVTNTEFSNNGTASNAFGIGAAIVNFADGFGAQDSMLIDSCTFANNIGQGTVFLGGESNPRPYTKITNSVFSNNASPSNLSAGTAIRLQNGGIVDIQDSDFTNNTTGGSGGVLFAFQIADQTTVIDTVANDTVVLFDYAEDGLPEVRITRSLFRSNVASSQGAVADINSGSITMTNSLLVENAISADGGSGGAVIINGTAGAPFRSENFFINNTFYGNADGGREGTGVDTLLAAAGNDIAIFQRAGMGRTDTNAVVLTIQNNVFYQEETAEESVGIELTGDDGNIIVNSLGGNFFTSNAQPELVINQVNNAADTRDVDAADTDLFLDPQIDFSEFPDLDLIRGDGNPLIDGGTTGPLVPEVDFFNEPRDSMPDIGAIEYNGPRVDVTEPIADSGLEIDFFPNPTIDVVNIVNNEAGLSTFTVLVSDMQGRYLTGRHFGSGKNVLNISHLPTGTYNLSLLIDGKVYSQQIMKK